MPGVNANSGENRKAAVDTRRWDLFEFISYLEYRIRFILVPVFLCTLAVAVYAFCIAPEKYEATSQIYVVNSKDSAINLSDLQIGSYLTSDYQYVFRTWEVNQQVINNLHLPYTVRQMREMLEVVNPSNTRILQITFTSEDAQEAAMVANEYAEVASAYIADTMLTSKPSIISTALQPLNPVSPRKKLLVAAAFILSALLSVWCLFIAFLFDDRIKTAADLKRLTGVEPLAVVPVTSLNKGDKAKGR